MVVWWVGKTWRGFVLGPAESCLGSPQPPPAWITAGLPLLFLLGWGGRGRSYLLRCCHQGGVKWGRILWGDLPMRKHREREQEAGKTMKLPGESASRWRGKAGRQMPGGHWLWRGACLWQPPPRSCPAEGFVFPRSVCASEPFSALSLVRSSLQNHSVSTDLGLTFWQWFRYIKEYIYPRTHNGYIYILLYNWIFIYVIYIYILFQILFPCRLLWKIEFLVLYSWSVSPSWNGSLGGPRQTTPPQDLVPPRDFSLRLSHPSHLPITGERWSPCEACTCCLLHLGCFPWRLAWLLYSPNPLLHFLFQGGRSRPCF